MKYLNKRIKANVVSYPLDEIDCFERSIGLCLNSYNNQYSDIFFLVWCFSRAYGINYVKSDLPFYKESYVIKKVFDLDLGIVKIKKGEDVLEYIRSRLYENNPVMVPINLKEIFYADQYKETDWPHLLVVKGMDTEKKIFHILDNTQIKSDELDEHDFTMTYESLVKAYNSYFNTIEKSRDGYIVYCSDRQQRSEVSDRRAFQNCFDIFLNESVMGYSELEDLASLKKEEISSEISSIINLPKAKKLFYELLLKKLLSFSFINQIKYEDKMSELAELIKEWQNYINICYKRLLTSGSLELPAIGNIQKLESELQGLFYIKFPKDFGIPLSRERRQVFENNDDNLMSTVNHEQIVFKFDGSQMYNSWIEDNSPKLLLGRKEIFELSTTVRITENDNANFVAGIFLRENGNLYFFGIDSCQRLNLDKAKFQNSICQLIGNFKTIRLKVLAEEKFLRFYYKFPSQDKADFILFYEERKEDLLIEFGIGCKTYNFPSPLQVTFEDIEGGDGNV